MEMVREQTETGKINSEEHGVVLEQDFDPFFAVVVVLASQRIVAKKCEFATMHCATLFVARKLESRMLLRLLHLPQGRPRLLRLLFSFLEPQYLRPS